MKRYFSLLSLFIFCFSFSVLAKEKTRQVFWSEFRVAFINHDFESLKEMTHFPLEVYGTLDDDPKFQTTKMQFSKCLSLIYKTDPGIDGSVKSHTDFIKKSPDLSTVFSNGKLISSYAPNEGFLIGDLLFSSAPFKLTRIYLDTSEKKVRKNCE